MKKLISMLLCGVLAVSMLTACGGSSAAPAAAPAAEEKKEEAAPAAEEKAEEPAAEEAKADPSITIKYCTWANEGEAAFEGMKEFKRLVEEGSNGDIAVELYPSNQLGSTNEQVEQIAMGELQMMSSGDPGVKEIEYLCLPYMFDSLAQYNTFLASDLGQSYIQKSIDERNCRIIETLPRSPRIISCNFPVNSLADLKNRKLRAPERDYYIETFKALGCNPTPMDMGEVYSAMQTGVVEGQENPIETIVSYGFQNVNSHLVMSNHIVKPAFVLISDEFYNSLSPEYQALISESCTKGREAAEEYMVGAMEKDLQTCIDAGMEVCEPDLAEFKEATQVVRDTLGTQIWGEEGYELVKSIADGSYKG